MEDRELDRALARAMGAEAHEWYQAGSVSPFHVSGHCVNFGPHQCYPNEASPQVLQDRIPAFYSTSIDALQAVEARLIAAGLYLSVNRFEDSTDATWFPTTNPSLFRSARDDAPTEARARAEAALLALRAIEPTSITTLASRTGSPT